MRTRAVILLTDKTGQLNDIANISNQSDWQKSDYCLVYSLQNRTNQRPVLLKTVMRNIVIVKEQ